LTGEEKGDVEPARREKRKPDPTHRRRGEKKATIRNSERGGDEEIEGRKKGRLDPSIHLKERVKILFRA